MNHESKSIQYNKKIKLKPETKSIQSNIKIINEKNYLSLNDSLNRVYLGWS